MSKIKCNQVNVIEKPRPKKNSRKRVKLFTLSVLHRSSITVPRLCNFDQNYKTNIPSDTCLTQTIYRILMKKRAAQKLYELNSRTRPKVAKLIT